MRARRIRSSFTTSCAGFTTARNSTSSIHAARRARSGPTAGSASTSARDIALANAIGARDSRAAGWRTASSSNARRAASKHSARASSPTRSSMPRRRPAFQRELIEELAHAYARRATRPALLDARHHRAPQRRRQRSRAHQPRAALRPRRAVRLGSQSAARTEQRSGRRRHGRDPQQVSRRPGRRRSGQPSQSSNAPGTPTLPHKRGWNLTDMFAAIERGELDTLYIIGENPAQSEADQKHAIELLRSLQHLIVQDIFLTKTGELAEVVFPASASWCESRRHGDEQRAARAALPQGARSARRGARRHRDPLRAGAPARGTTGPTIRPKRRGTSAARSRRGMPA